jgi:pimeloyl-ACP methyl ester carboxylesterase
VKDGGVRPAERRKMPVIAADGVSTLEIQHLKIELLARGQHSRPLLFLHPEIGLDPDAPVIGLLAARARLIAPAHPGFGRSEVARSMTTVDDIAYFYLDFLEALDLRDVILVGAGLGGWIAAEIAIKSTARLSSLVLADALGIKVSDRETRDIVDIFALTEPELAELTWFDPASARRDPASLSEAELQSIARNREASARYGWSPYMHDPKLKGRLHRIRIPTLVLWGAADRIVKPDYGRAFCAAIPGARFELIERAGHFPHLEQPEDFAQRVLAFAGGR